MSDAKTTTCGLCQAAFPYEPQLLPPNSFMVEIPAPHLCPDCTAAETQRREAEIEQERREEERRDDASRNLPTRYRNTSFASFTAHSESQARALAAVRDHAMEGVYLQGRAGSRQDASGGGGHLGGSLGQPLRGQHRTARR